MKRMKRFFLMAFIFTAMTLGTAVVHAGDYYVQQSVGSDGNPGTGWGAGHALRTIQKAVNLAIAGGGADTIHVAAGTYSEHVVMENANQITLLGGYPSVGGTARDPSANVTAIDGSSTGVPAYIHASTNITMDGFLVQHGVNDHRPCRWP